MHIFSEPPFERDQLQQYDINDSCLDITTASHPHKTPAAGIIVVHPSVAGVTQKFCGRGVEGWIAGAAAVVYETKYSSTCCKLGRHVHAHVLGIFV